MHFERKQDMQDTSAKTEAKSESPNGFFINAGIHAGWFTTPDGDIYDVRKLEPREVQDPRSGEIAVIWGGYATARDRDMAARDAALQDAFRKDGKRPEELFAAESRDIPLYITLRNRPGKGYTDIGSFWNARGRYTILATDRQGRNGLRFGGNVLPWKSPAALEAERGGKETAAQHDPDEPAAQTEPDGEAARNRAQTRRSKASTPKVSANEQT